MYKRLLGKTGFNISEISLGTWQVGGRWGDDFNHTHADTFWEIYDPNNAYLSPCHSHLFNSYCHTWSCTPAWFLRHPVYGQRLKLIDNSKL